MVTNVARSRRIAAALQGHVHCLAPATSMGLLPGSRLLSLPLTLALLATAACGGSVKNGESESDAGSSGDGATAADAVASDGAEDGGLPEATPGLVAVPLFSCSQASVYTAGASIGGTQQFQLSVDTGSTTLGVASTMCSGCGVTPEYTPGASAVDQHTTATSQYGSGSWSGEIYQDSVGLAAAASTPVKLVAIDTQMQFFQPLQCDSKPGESGSMQGILGMGPGVSAVAGTNGYFDQFVATTGLPDVFATELCDSGGTLWLGGYDPAATTAAPQYVPFSKDVASQYYYAVGLTSITVNGTTVPIASTQFADSIVDTGTSVFLMGTTAFNAISAAIGKDPMFTTLFGGASFFSSQGCGATTKTKAQLDAALPAMTLTFGSVQVQALPTESYLFGAGQGNWCPSIYGIAQDQNFPIASIMGAPILRSNVVIFDRAQKRIGWAPHKACP